MIPLLQQPRRWRDAWVRASSALTPIALPDSTQRQKHAAAAVPHRSTRSRNSVCRERPSGWRWRRPGTGSRLTGTPKAALLGHPCRLRPKSWRRSPEGSDAISVEDLGRDAFALQGRGAAATVRRGIDGGQASRPASSTDGWSRVRPRLGDAAGRRWDAGLWTEDGRARAVWSSSFVTPRTGASGPIDLAALISLAKAYDTTDRPAATVVLCGQFGGDVSPTLGSSPPVPVAERVGPVLVVSGFGSGKAPEWVDTPPLESGGPALSWRSQEREPTTTLDGVDYRVVAAEVRELHGGSGRHSGLSAALLLRRDRRGGVAGCFAGACLQRIVRLGVAFCSSSRVIRRRIFSISASGVERPSATGAGTHPGR